MTEPEIWVTLGIILAVIIGIAVLQIVLTMFRGDR